jgi:hypothetical protein
MVSMALERLSVIRYGGYLLFVTIKSVERFDRLLRLLFQERILSMCLRLLFY